MTKQDQLENEGLKEQIRLYKEKNRILQQSLKDVKASQYFMKQQIELGQDREKLLFIREQRDFQRIIELERKIELLGPPSPQNVNTVDAEDITPSSQSKKSSTENLENTDEIEEGVDYESEEMQELVDQALKKSEQNNNKEEATYETIIAEEKEKIEPLSVEIDLSEEKDQVEENESFEPVEDQQNDETESQSMGQDDEKNSEEPIDDHESVIAEDRPDEAISIEKENKTEGRPAEGRPTEPQNEPTERTFAESDLAPNQSYLINEYFNKGLAAAGKKNYDDAIVAFTKVANLLPDAAPSFLNLAIVYFRMGNLEEASNFNQKAIERGSDPAQRLQAKIEAELNRRA